MFKWFKNLFKTDHLSKDIGKVILPTVENLIPMPKVKQPKGKDISEPVWGIIRAFEENPKRFKFDMDRNPTPDYFWQDRYSQGTTGCYFRVIDRITGESFNCSVSGLPTFTPNASKTFMSYRGYICALGYALIHSEKIIGKVHNGWITPDESDLLVETIGNQYADRIMKVFHYREAKETKEERAAAIKKALDLVEERQRLCEVYK